MDRGREQGHLDRVEPGPQRVRRVTREDRETFLGDGRPAVDVARDEVDRGARLPVTGGEYGRGGPAPRRGRCRRGGEAGMGGD